MQIFALLILLLAALILEKVLHLDDLYLLITGLWKGSVNIFGWYYRENENDDDEEAVMLSRTRFYFGICPLLLASLISGLSGALVQKCLQVSGRNSFMYSVELCVASIIILAVSLLFTDDGRKISTVGAITILTEYTSDASSSENTSFVGQLIVAQWAATHLFVSFRGFNYTRRMGFFMVTRLQH